MYIHLSSLCIFSSVCSLIWLFVHLLTSLNRLYFFKTCHPTTFSTKPGGIAIERERLVIKNVKARDVGMYQCEVNHGNDLLTTSTDLHVRG